MGSASEAQIDLDALCGNFAEARDRARGREVIAVVKADAYGHGAVAVARALCAAGCHRLAVAHMDEAVALRDAGIDAPLLVFLGARDSAEAEAALAQRVTPVLHSAADLERVARAARARGTAASVQVEVDTGMHRLGCPPEDAPELLERVVGEPGIALEGVFTHFARADEPDLEPSLRQLRRFRRVLELARAAGIEPPLVHAANSAGLLAGDVLFAAMPEVNAVRPGIMLYGVHPAPHLPGRLRPVMTLRARVVALRTLRAGRAVGYAALHRTESDTRVATLSLGYADGLPVSASNRGEVWIRGRRRPIVGRVSMDSSTIDVGDLPVEMGDEAVVFGAEPGAPRVEEAAAAAGTLSYELLTRVGTRVPRRIRDRER